MEKKKNAALTKERNRLRRKRDGKYAIILCSLFAMATTVVYFSVPNAAHGGNGDNVGTSTSHSPYVPDGGDKLTPTQKFTANLTGMQGLTADLSLQANYPDNVFAVSSTLAFSMPELSLNAIGLNMAANVTYNGTAVTVNDGAAVDTFDMDMVGGDFYVSIMGINYKSEADSRVDFFKNLIRIFSIESAQIDIDTSSVASGDGLSSFTDALSNIVETDLDDGTYEFTLSIDGYDIIMTADKDCVLTGAYTKEDTPIALGDWKIAFTLSKVTVTDDIHIVNPEDTGKTYLEINDQVELIEKIYNVYKGKNVGLSFAGSLRNGTADLALNGGANVDFSSNNFLEDTFDLNLGTTYSYFANEGAADKTSDSQSLAAVYTPEAAYLTYNENALRAKMTHDSMESLIDSMKDKFGQAETQSADTAFDFITSSELMTNIYDGHYETVVSMLKKVETSNNYLKLTVSLSKLGLGDDSQVTLTFDGGASSSSLATIEVSDVVLSSSVTVDDLTIKTEGYSSEAVDAAKVGTGYMSLDFADGVFNQLYNLANEQKFGLALNSQDDAKGTNGTIIEKTGTADKFILSGGLQADVPSKVGTGTLNVIATSSNWGSSTSQTHSITADLTGGSATEDAKLLFSYKDKITADGSTTGGDKPLNGSLAVDSIEDIVSQVKSAVSPDAPDQRWAKFFDGMKSEAATTVMGRLMDQDFGALLETKILKSVTTLRNQKTGLDEIKVIVDGHLIGDDGNDIVVYLPLGVSAENTDEVKGVRLENFVYGDYTINLDASLTSYNDGKLTNLVEDNTYLNLNSLKTLVKFGIKTSYLTSFHLTATMNVNMLINISMAVDVDFYLSVVDKTVKVSGYFNNIPLLSAVNNTGRWALFDDFSGKAHRDVQFYYEAPADGGTGGNVYFYEFNRRPVSGDTTTYKKVYAPYFTKNLLYYLLNDVVALKDSYIDSIQKKSESGSDEPIDIESVLDSYSCANEESATPSFNFVMDMAVLSNNSQLGDMDVTINTNSGGYLSSLDFKLSFNIPVLNLSLTATVDNVDIGEDCWTGDFKSQAADAWAAMVARTSFDSVEGYGE
ncbi:MAG: hypothetical protein LKG11_04505 [Bacilli bacterium]|jgi:hypothetical protein|nr:hypothetical protein [Bacilli bacterium]